MSPVPKATAPKAAATKTGDSGTLADFNVKTGSPGKSSHTGTNFGGEKSKEPKSHSEHVRQTHNQMRRIGNTKRPNNNILPGMSDATGHNMYMVAYAGSLAIITYQELKDFNRLPLPSRYIGASLAFGILAILEPVITPKLSGTLAWGLLVGLAYMQSQHQTVNAIPPGGVTPIPLNLGGQGSNTSGTSDTSQPTGPTQAQV